MTAYTDATTIAAYLGVTFTPEQEAAAEQAAAAATAFIDRYTGRTWQTASPVVGELVPVLPAGHGTPYPAASGAVYLQLAPVSAVSAVSLRTPHPNATETALDAAEYELLDPAHGVLTVVGHGWCAGLLAVVDYTHADTVPPDISLAATMIAAGVMQQQMTIAAGSSVIAENPQLAGLQSISVGQNDINVTLSKTATSGASLSSSAGSSWAAPGSAVAAILDLYRRVVIA